MATKGDISDLAVLMFGGKPIIPQVAIGGYSRSRRSGVINSDTTGGATRQRKKYFNGVHVAEVTFYLETPSMQDYFEMFMVQNEGKRWICHLQADRPLIEPYVVQAITDAQYSNVTAKDATVSIQIEIYSVRDPELDAYLIEQYQTIGDLSEWYNAWREVVKEIPRK